MSARIGVVFRPDFSPDTLRDTASAADRAGVAELWLWEDCFLQGGIAAAAVALASSETLTVGLGVLPAPLRKTVRTLASILRVAESLDRSHTQTISSLDFRDRGDDALLQVHTTGDAELEVWATNRHLQPFERILGKPVRLEAAAAPTERRPAPRQVTQGEDNTRAIGTRRSGARTPRRAHA